MIGRKLAEARAPVAFLLPLGGIQEWDKPTEPLHDPDGLAAFIEAMRPAVPSSATLFEIGSHINAPEFAEKALAVFDDWVSRGIVLEGRP